MASVSKATNPTYDPIDTATNLANDYVSSRRKILTQKSNAATATATALGKLNSALTTFTGALSAMSGKKSIVSNTATFSSTGFGTGTATAAAVPGTYSFFVQQVASANQVSVNLGGTIGAPASFAAGGSLTVSQGNGTSFSVDLANGGNPLTPQQLAAAINAAPDNASQVTASVVTVNGQSQLVLTSAATGLNSAISVDASGAADANLRAALAPNNAITLAPPRDALVYLGAPGAGTLLQQSSNVYNVIDGVTMTFTAAQPAGSAPLTLTVGNDNSATIANAQALVDAYNKMRSALDALTAPGNPDKNLPAAVFANDSGIQSLKDILAQTMRETVALADGTSQSLSNYGFRVERDGSMSLDATRLTAALKAKPNGLDGVIGSATKGSQSGVMGDLAKYIDKWTSSTNGQISARQASVSKQQSQLSDAQDKLDREFKSLYDRYLIKFTNLQNLQKSMETTTSMLDALFGDSKK